MNKFITVLVVLLAMVHFSCNSEKTGVKNANKQVDSVDNYLAPIDSSLPTIGLLMYKGVLQSEVIATSDVFSKLNKEGVKLFNVVTISESKAPIVTEEGIRILPDYTFDNTPKLTALFVPSAYDMAAQLKNGNLINFIQNKNKETKYVVSNCSGAQLIGEAGIADGRKVVTWIGGGVQLQKDYPNLKVQNDSLVTFIEDGKFSSSNGNLASYISALNLLEKMSNVEHREFVESYLYLDRLQNWKK